MISIAAKLKLGQVRDSEKQVERAQGGGGGLAGFCSDVIRLVAAEVRRARHPAAVNPLALDRLLARRAANLWLLALRPARAAAAPYLVALYGILPKAAVRLNTALLQAMPALDVPVVQSQAMRR